MSEPPRKRTRSVMSPEERKEARAHRNRIAAQNSRDRRKAHFAHLERRVAELEEENRHLRAGLPASPSPSVSEPEVVTDHDQSRKRAEEQRERENQQLRERIRALEIGYRTVVRALADQGKSLPSSSHPPFTPLSPSSSPRSPSPVEHCSSPSAASATLSSINPTYPLSPTPTHSTLVDSPLTLAPTSLDLSFSPAFSPLSSTSLLDSPSDSFDLSLSSDAPTRHLAAGGQHTHSDKITKSSQEYISSAVESESDTASDAIIACLLAEIIASPSGGVGALPSVGTASEETRSAEAVSASGPVPLEGGLRLGKSTIDDTDWMKQVRAEMEMDRLLKSIPDAHDVVSGLNTMTNLDVDMDFSNMIVWDEVSAS
ncbi:hypothetical protein V8B97DRAFT_1937900 [Scleroderma yunnanense]